MLISYAMLTRKTIAKVENREVLHLVFNFSSRVVALDGALVSVVECSLGHTGTKKNRTDI